MYTPTHGMGPACQLLNIHRGDRMKYLVAMDSDPIRCEISKEHGKGTEAQKTTKWRNHPDINTYRKEKQSEIEHNVASPRPYSRLYQLTGTKGFADKYPVRGLCAEQ